MLAIDRGFGGGATALSGGIVYAGGGTRYQKAADVDDDPDNMFQYLTQEVRNAVSDDTLRRFCDESAETISWLERQEASFQASLAPFKTWHHTTMLDGHESATALLRRHHRCSQRRLSECVDARWIGDRR